MIQASHVAVELDLEAIPVLEGAIETVQMGITSSLQPQNLQASRLINNLSKVENCSKYSLLFDPQTSGGLLATISADKAASCLASLQAYGYKHSGVIGQVIPATQGVNPIAIAC
jgi:selenide,water dikinase